MARYARNVAATAKPSAAPAMPNADDIRSFAEHARQLVDDEVSLRFGRSASELNRLAEVLRTASARLEGTFTAPYFEGAAKQIDRAAAMLKNANTREMISSVRGFAQQSPLWFVGAALALGVGAGRFLRSSAAPALPSGPSAPAPARPAARKQSQPSFSNTRDES